MKTRIGKIAQLPKPIRDELNQRLEDGKQSPELLKWLNALPETENVLAEKFESQPITKSNLSDWRQGGYQDWLRLQQHEERIRRITESGDTLEQSEGNSDLFENFARLVIAELAADLESLDHMKNRDQRWQRLRELSRELTRLQNGYNRSRWAELAWTKWNDRYGESDDPDPVPNPQLETPNPEPKPPHSISPAAAVVPDRAQSCSPEVRFVHHTPCGCLCRQCHSEDGPYPYWDAERDIAARKKTRRDLIEKADGKYFYLLDWNCDCTCA